MEIWWTFALFIMVLVSTWGCIILYKLEEIKAMEKNEKMKKPYIMFKRESDGQVIMGFAEYDLQLPRIGESVDIGIFGFCKVTDVIHSPHPIRDGVKDVDPWVKIMVQSPEKKQKEAEG